MAKSKKPENVKNESKFVRGWKNFWGWVFKLRSVGLAIPVAVAALTAVCLLLMFISKKVLYPWLISIFSLVLPILILITNIFPA